MPVLMLPADRTVRTRGWSDEYTRADGVPDARHIRALAPRLGPRVTTKAIPGGLHDLVLSPAPVREAVYRELFAWLALVLS